MGYAVARRDWNDARAVAAGLHSGRNCYEFRVFWLNQGKPLHPNPVATSPIEVGDKFEIRGGKSRSENQGLCKGNPQRAGSENLSNLCGCSMMKRWPVIDSKTYTTGWSGNQGNEKKTKVDS